jgi:hypothetical protein
MLKNVCSILKFIFDPLWTNTFEGAQATQVDLV